MTGRTIFGRLSCTLWFVCLLIFAGTEIADAQETGRFDPVSVAVINFRAVLSRSDAAKSIREAVDARRAEYREKFAAIEKKLLQEQKELARTRSILSTEAFEEQSALLKQKARAAQQEAQARNRQLNRAFDAAFEKVQKALFDVVAEIAEEFGIHLVLFRSSIVLAVKKLEITGEALARLNEKVQKVDVEFELAPE